MPIKDVNGGVKWGDHGKLYKGKGARKKAEKQAAAAHANGYKESTVDDDSHNDPEVPSHHLKKFKSFKEFMQDKEVAE